jgi:uncharacterized protein (DUF849 family)
MEDLIVNLTPTGMIPTKVMTPNVPVTPSEIIDDVLKCSELGVTMVHIHARNEKEEPTWEPEVYEETITGIRTHMPEIIICVSCSGRTYKKFEERSAVLDLDGAAKPDMGSLTLSSLNFNKIASVNEPEMIKKLCLKMKEQKIKPELEAFDLGMINYAKYLINKNLIGPPFYFNLIFGNIACAQANILSMGLMENELPDNSIWSFGGVGDYQTKVNSVAVANGGGIRVGLEDNIWFDTNRTILATNYTLIKRMKDIANSMQREIMSPEKLREILGLNSSKEGYGLK